jgi:hypothetical protein
LKYLQTISDIKLSVNAISDIDKISVMDIKVRMGNQIEIKKSNHVTKLW